MAKKERFISYQDKRISLDKRNKYLKFALFMFCVYEILTTFVVQTYRVVNKSMDVSYPIFSQVFASPLFYGPTLWGGKRIKNFRTPIRGEVFILETPQSANASTLKELVSPFFHFITLQAIRFNSDKEPLGIARTTIKRVVGIPGDTIKMEDYVIYIKPKGSNYFLSEFELAKKSYEIKKSTLPNTPFPKSLISSSFNELTLAHDEYFVLGDNRVIINDSRTFGVLNAKSFKAKVISRYWSWIFF